MCKFRPCKKKLLTKNFESNFIDENISKNPLQKDAEKSDACNFDEQKATNTSESSHEVALGFIPPEQQEFADDLNDVFEEKKVNWQGVELSENLSASKIWGILTVKLREKNHLTLHTACGEIRDIVREGNHLTASVFEDYLYSILTQENNFDKILFELKQIDDKITLEFIHKKRSREKFKENLQILKNLFGNKLRVE